MGANQISHGPYGNYIVTDISGQKYAISSRFRLSPHNCKCRGRKTGLVLYPVDKNHENTVLLVCENHFGYQSNDATQHKQLLQWYYRIYGDSKQYRFVSGFSQKDNGSLSFNSISQNAVGPYTNNKKEMSSIEQKIVNKIVSEQLHSYDANVG
ncbi:unnamed protein product [Adineta steineri]|uniref:Uncharacterized protein n=1 Tax=Adineta steineri TaxID=433720 RepID=A0A816CK84_9BILA|nr:unnamed protein product [Adineta steineri]CAF0828986.1 unnamed protein product [Adineta steineri]CAF0877728.1 unnamed protein product [Adineta steineri]CAF1436255.1 unnamed protein product [Adineta steineri]CAF1626036.1 unnamed protein product [Adineta steineri]